MFWNEKHIEKQPLSHSQTHHLHVGRGLVPAQHHAGSGRNRLQPHVGPGHVRVQPYVEPGRVHAQPHVCFLNIIICYKYYYFSYNSKCSNKKYCYLYYKYYYFYYNSKY